MIIWNLSEENRQRTGKVVDYVLKNFDKLFEAGWTALYYDLCNIDQDISKHTLKEFYEEQIAFDAPYYSIQLEINCDHLADGVARYCFVVATAIGQGKWVISDDDMRVYMVGNKACGFSTNNDDCQMLYELDDYDRLYGKPEEMEPIYEKMDNFNYAEPFQD